MTVCIAGITESRKIVAITDKMLTTAVPAATKYEIPSNKKAIQISKSAVALFAGDVTHANEILSLAKKKLTETPTEKIEVVAETVVTAYREYLTRMINDYLFSKFGINLGVFMSNQGNLDADFVKNTNKVIGEFVLQVQIIVAGVDESPHIFTIGSPGFMNVSDSMGYACVGSGSQHATLSLIESSYHAGIDEGLALHALLEAKKRAEFDPGVGALCDIVLINDGYTVVSDPAIDKLMEIYGKSTGAIEQVEKECAAALKKTVYAS